MAYSSDYKKEQRTESYDPNEDYMKKMTEAAQAGDYAAAAQYEQQRNAKIAGEGLTQYQQTNQYAKYLPKTSQQQMSDILDRIMNREDFSYDMDADALYQQYKDKYIKQGNLAMQDTMGQAAALTGGYGNSYAQTVGQQAYNSYLGQLNDVVPELYALAKQRYDDEGDALLEQYSLLADRENTAYSREYAQQQREDSMRSEQEDRAYSLALSMLQSGVMPSDDLLSGSGISAEDAQSLLSAYTTQTYSYSGSGSGSGSGEREALPEKYWNELFASYQEGVGNGDLSAFKSLMANYGRTYDMTEFNTWAKSTLEGYDMDSTYGEGLSSVSYNELLQALHSSNEDRVRTLLDLYSGQMSQSQWAQIEALLEQRGIY